MLPHRQLYLLATVITPGDYKPKASSVFIHGGSLLSISKSKSWHHQVHTPSKGKNTFPSKQVCTHTHFNPPPLRLLNVIYYYYCCYYFIIIIMCACTGMHIKLRGQLFGVGSHLPLKPSHWLHIDFL